MLSGRLEVIGNRWSFFVVEMGGFFSRFELVWGLGRTTWPEVMTDVLRNSRLWLGVMESQCVVVGVTGHIPFLKKLCVVVHVLTLMKRCKPFGVTGLLIAF